MTKKIKRYSEAFKLQVVGEYEAGSTISELKQKYGITGGQTVQGWIRKYAKSGLRHDLIRIQVAEEINRIKDLEHQVKELEQALGKVMLEKLKLESILEVLSAGDGKDLKKNEARSSQRLSGKPGNGRRAG